MLKVLTTGAVVQRGKGLQKALWSGGGEQPPFPAICLRSHWETNEFTNNRLCVEKEICRDGRYILEFQIGRFS